MLDMNAITDTRPPMWRIDPEQQTAGAYDAAAAAVAAIEADESAQRAVLRFFAERRGARLAAIRYRRNPTESNYVAAATAVLNAKSARLEAVIAAGKARDLADQALMERSSSRGRAQ